MIHTPIKDQEVFQKEVQTLCHLYESAQSLNAKRRKVISCNKKTGIQALERETTAMKTGQVERQDHEYDCHGTQCLIANFDVATGKIIAPTIRNTRIEKDFEKHIKQTSKIDASVPWIFLCDNLNAHHQPVWRGLWHKPVKSRMTWTERANGRAEIAEDTAQMIG